jgi:hypothetical protein
MFISNEVAENVWVPKGPEVVTGETSDKSSGEGSKWD